MMHDHAAPPHRSTEPERLVEAIRGPSPQYKHDELDAILARADDCVPHLLQLLDEVADDPAAAAARLGEDRFGVVYAFALLVHLRVVSAHDAIVQIARAPVEVFETLLGDVFVTEGLDEALFVTAGGRTDGIRDLLCDTSADGYLRGQAAKALAWSVRGGHLGREDALEVLVGLLDEGVRSDDESLLAGIVEALIDLRAVERIDAIREAMLEGCIPPGHMSLEDVEESLATGAHALTGPPDVDDIHGRCGWWACFAEAT